MRNMIIIIFAVFSCLIIYFPAIALDSYSQEHPEYWFAILGKRESLDANNRRNPSPALLRKSWVEITSMPAEKAWIILTQIQYPDSPDLYPVNKVLEWANKNVSAKYILGLMHEKKNHLVYNNWLFSRWAYFYVKECGGDTEKKYLQSLIKGYPTENKAPLDENVYLALHSLLKEPAAKAMLMDAFKTSHVSIEKIFDAYGVEGVCFAARLAPDPRIKHAWFKGIDQYYIYAPLLAALEPPTKDDSSAVERWHLILVVLQKLERFSGGHVSNYPPNLESLCDYRSTPVGSEKTLFFIRSNELWERARGKIPKNDYQVFKISDLKTHRIKWLKVIDFKSIRKSYK